MTTMAPNGLAEGRAVFSASLSSQRFGDLVDTTTNLRYVSLFTCETPFALFSVIYLFSPFGGCGGAGGTKPFFFVFGGKGGTKPSVIIFFPFGGF